MIHNFTILKKEEEKDSIHFNNSQWIDAERESSYMHVHIKLGLSLQVHMIRHSHTMEVWENWDLLHVNIKEYV
jgi:hypothetical protein